MQNAGLDRSQTKIKLAGRNINNLRYADGTILIAENKEELKRLFMRVKELAENSTFKKLKYYLKIYNFSIKFLF